MEHFSDGIIMVEITFQRHSFGVSVLGRIFLFDLTSFAFSLTTRNYHGMQVQLLDSARRQALIT